MDTKVEHQPGFMDTAKLLLAAFIVVAGLVAYYYFADASVLLRAVGVLASLAIASWVGFQSSQGQSIWKFIQSSRVVWPTREETIQTTIAVMVFALIMGVFFWLLDLGLLYLSSRLTGQGG